jgi:hypothetical protein
MKFIYILVFLFALTIPAQAQLRLQTELLQMELGKNGFLTALIDRTSGINYLAPDTLAPLLMVISGGQRYMPTKAVSQPKNKKITLHFAPSAIQVDVRYATSSSHLTLEITRAQPAERIEALVWGPYPTTIAQTIGEVIGVVRDSAVALGIQVLNHKTLGGNYPNREGMTWARGEAAVAQPWGSLLQAYAINRALPRQVDAWGGTYKNMPVPPIPGETVVGSKIAFFLCPEKNTLDRLEAIELAENLPHPTIKGVWFKKSPYFGRSYLISSFNESNIDQMIAFTKRAGLMSLYHEGLFKSWGHFVLDTSQFPNGRAGLKSCAEKAHAAGLLLGVHTLSNFINTNDPYVSPLPDARLSCTGTSVLTKACTETDQVIDVADPAYFKEMQGNTLHAVRIGEEIIRYARVSETAPWRLLDCQRGAFGTRAAAHPASATACKLFDHPYEVFFPNFEMQRETARQLATFLNETTVDHLDFDGFEGGLASGQGDFGVEQFALDVFRQVPHDLLMGTSLSKTFFWHLCSYYNWGEPWYGGFRESMQQYRIDNQALFERNFMPHMLGWYLLTENTTLQEMEWMLARAGGYNAGFAMVARPDALQKNPQTDALLDAIREWETARTSGAFSRIQQTRMQEPSNEFHLKKIKDNHWQLAQWAFSPVLIHEKKDRQPGEPLYSRFLFHQTWSQQPWRFRLAFQAEKGTVRNIQLQLNQSLQLELPVTLQAGESIVCDGSGTLLHYNKEGRMIARIQWPDHLPATQPGEHQLQINARFQSDGPATLEYRAQGLLEPEDCIPAVKK